MEPRGRAPRDALPAVGSMTMDEIERAMIVKSLAPPRRQHQPRGGVAGAEPGRAVPAAGEVRDRACEPAGARFVLYLLVVHLLFAAPGRARSFRGQPLLAARASRRLLVASLPPGCALVRSAVRARSSCSAKGAQLLAESDFTTRFREAGQPEMDELIRVYNRMVDHLREERVRPQEQHYFLAQILRRLALGRRHPRLRRRACEFANPAAERLLGRRAAS